jgi:hypothetical protein
VTDGTRTRDVQDHNLALYQLSYGHHGGAFCSAVPGLLPIRGNGSIVHRVSGAGQDSAANHSPLQFTVMSQFPSPYTPPSVSISYEPAPHTLLAGPRRTGMLMLVLGSLVVLMGACNAITALLIPASELLQRQRAFLVNAPPMLPPEQMRHWTMAVGGATVAVGILLVILGAAVRRGNRGAIGAALGITSLLVLICGIATLVFLLGGLAEPAMLPLACFPAAPLLLMGWR